MAANLNSEAKIELEEEEEKEDLEKLESELKKMVMKISDYRKAILRNFPVSALPSLRPVSYSSPSSSIPTLTDLQKMARFMELAAKKVARLLKLTKRLRECAERIDKLKNSPRKETIHPTFKRRRTDVIYVRY